MDVQILNLSFLLLLLTCVCIINSAEEVRSGAKRSLHKDRIASGTKKFLGLKNKEFVVHFVSEAGSKDELKRVIKRDSAPDGSSESKSADDGASTDNTNVDEQGSLSSKNHLEGEKKEESEVSESLKAGSETSEKDKNEGENEKTNEGENGKTEEGENGKTEEGENGKTGEGENGKTGEGENEEKEKEKPDEENKKEENIHEKDANEDTGKSEKEEVEENTDESVKGISPLVPEIIESTSSIETTSNAVSGSEEHSTTTISATSGKSTETAPLNTYFVRKDDEICLLVKFQAYIVFEDEAGTYYPPESADTSGKCGKKISFITISWDEYTFTMNFSRAHNGKQCFWTVVGLNLKRVAGASYYYIKDETKGDPFKIECQMSYYCSESVIHLYKKDDDEDTANEVIVKLKHMELQPFGVENGQFSEDVHKCREDVMGTIGIPREHAIASAQDETVPLAVGLTLAILTLLAVLGFSIHRAYVMRKVDYNSME